MREAVGSFDDSGLFEKIGVGTLGSEKVYKTPGEFDYLMSRLLVEFPEVILYVKVGSTYEKRNIPGYVLGLSFTDSTW